jgi:hypothetical protein
MTNIECPSGLAECIRGIKVSEERIIAGGGRARTDGQVKQILKSCRARCAWREGVVQSG